MSKWKDVQLRDVLQPKGYIRGPFGSALRRNELLSHGIPVYEQQHAIYGVRTFRFFIDDDKYEEMRRFTTLPDDIIISCSGTLGKVSRIKANDPKGIISQALLLLRADTRKIRSRYLQYFLSSKEGFNAMISRSSGSVQVNLARREIIEAIPFGMPDLQEQDRILNILTSLDNKIDLLVHQNATIEALAQTYFRQWFVEDASDDWEVVRLETILKTIESGSRPKGGIDPNLIDGVPNIGAESINGLGVFDFSKTKYVTRDFFDNMHRGVVKSHDVLIYKDGVYVGRKGMFGNGFPFAEFAVNEHVFILRANEKAGQIFLYFLLQEEELAQLNSNSAQPGLNQQAMNAFEISLPPIGLIRDFERLAEPLVDKIFGNANQIRTLQKLRDTLLPKLISGEVRVKQ